MKVTLESTTQIVDIVELGVIVHARVWEGETDTGIKCFALITRIAIHESDVARAPEFERELLAQKPPTDISVGDRGTGVFPIRMVLP